MKKIAALILAAGMMLPAFGLAEPADNSARDAVLITAAEDMTSQLIGLCSTNAYIKTMTAGDEISDVVSETLAGDYTQSEHTLVVSIDGAYISGTIEALAALSEVTFPTDAALTNTLRMRIYSMFNTMANSYEGTTWLAASTIMTTSDVMQLDGVNDCIAYVISDYGDELPLVSVAFNVKDGGLTSANATFLKLDDETRATLFANDWSSLVPAEAADLLAPVTFNVYATSVIVD